MRGVDCNGDEVREGDTIAFSYGISPVRVESVLIERDGVLIAPTPGHKPHEASLRQLRKHVGIFWKVEAGE